MAADAAGARSSRAARHGAGLAGALGLYALTALVAVTLVFLLPRLMPGDPLQARVDPDNAAAVADERTRARLLAYYGLDRPLPVQYADYLGSVARGDLGWSITRNAPVIELIGASLPWTLLLVGSALVLSSLVGFFGGIAAAWRRDRGLDRLLVVATTAVRSLPDYAWAAVLLILLGVVIPVFPLSGARTPFAAYESLGSEVADVALHLALPLLALTLGLVAGKFLLVRNTAVSALGQDYMVLARAKGLPERLLKYRHAGRNALLPFLALLGVQAGFVIGGAVFVEATFAYPGMGTLILRAVEERDYPVLEGSFLALAATVLTLNALVDVTLSRLDPRVRAS